MTPERWLAVGELFELALTAPVNERTILIDRLAQTDDEVRREVRSLLASHQAVPGGFVQKRIDAALESFQQTSTGVSAPTRVGPYRLMRELGRGGMGTVFLAERDDDEYRARVAIKLVRPGMDTEFILARFRRERQTLARLQHPNISRLLDGGTTDDGLPYIVMEYIDGPWITRYAAQHALAVETRLRLFLAVCSAVDYAHRNFIVHRDLKPGNILVDTRGVPKLLDFGICKLLVEAGNAATDTVAALLTPRYASPEQIRGEAATPSSDIYSLGAVLYELLTGTGPRRFENLTALAIQRALETPIVRPSAAVDEPRLARQLTGDLDNIVSRALDASPGRRYDSAAQLADDVRRHLLHEPVTARPQTLAYRAYTFVRRHRGAVAAAAAVGGSVMAAAAVALYEARRADARVGHIRSLASTLVLDGHEALQAIDRAIARVSIPAVANNRELRLALADGYMDSSNAKRHLGDVRGACAAAAESLRLYFEAAGAGWSTPVVLSGVANMPASIGASEKRRAHLRPGHAHFHDAAAMPERFTAAEPRDAGMERALMLAYGQIGDVLGKPGIQKLGQRRQALRAYGQAADVARRLYELDRSDRRAAADYSNALNRVDTAMDGNDCTQKLAVQRERLRMLDELGRRSPHDMTLRTDRAIAHLDVGNTLTAAGEVDNAHLAYLNSAAIAEPSLAHGDATLLVMFIRANQRLALNAVARGRRADALAFAVCALDAGDSSSADARMLRAGQRGVSAMGLTYAALMRSQVGEPGDRQNALRWLREAAQGWQKAQPGTSVEAPDRREMREIEAALAQIEGAVIE